MCEWIKKKMAKARLSTQNSLVLTYLNSGYVRSDERDGYRVGMQQR